MRILRITPAGGHGKTQFGGAERGNVNQARALNATGLEVVTASPSEALARELESAGCKHLQLDTFGHSNRPTPSAIRSAIREQNPDVVHLQLLAGALSGHCALFASRPRKPVLVSFHNSMRDIARSQPGSIRSGKTNLLALVERSLGNFSNASYLAVSEYEASTMTGPIHGRRRISVIVNELPLHGLRKRPNPDERSSYWSSYGVDPTHAIVGFFGRHEQQKGADFVAEVAATLGNSTTIVTTSSGSVELPNSVTRLPHQPNLLPMLAHCDAVLMPSRYEAFGRLAVETVASCTPLVFSAVGGLAEVTKGLSGAVLFPTRELTTPAIQATLQKALAASSSAANSDEATSDASRLLERYSLERSTAAWTELYTSLGAT